MLKTKWLQSHMSEMSLIVCNERTIPDVINISNFIVISTQQLHVSAHEEALLLEFINFFFQYLIELSTQE